jgi:hypothetical protein
VIAIIWLAGFMLCRWMLKVEHEAESATYTNGDQALLVILSILSFAMVLFILVKTWAVSVKSYWSRPVNNTERVKNKKTTTE